MQKLSLFGVLLLALSVCGQLASHGDGAAHIVIVTPQSQVHLEPLAGTYIHHLSPFLRLIAPLQQEEAIVYVPSNAAILPLPNAAAGLSPANARQDATQIQQAIQIAQQAIGGAAPALSEAASAAAASAVSSGSSFFPAFFPPPPNKDALKPALPSLPPLPPLAAPATPLLESQRGQLSAMPQTRAARYMTVASTIPQWLDVMARVPRIQDLEIPSSSSSSLDQAQPEEEEAHKKTESGERLPLPLLLDGVKCGLDLKKSSSDELPADNKLIEAKPEKPLIEIQPEEPGLKLEQLRSIGVEPVHRVVPDVVVPVLDGVPPAIVPEQVVVEHAPVSAVLAP